MIPTNHFVRFQLTRTHTHTKRKKGHDRELEAGSFKQAMKDQGLKPNQCSKREIQKLSFNKIGWSSQSLLLASFRQVYIHCSEQCM